MPGELRARLVYSSSIQEGNGLSSINYSLSYGSIRFCHGIGIGVAPIALKDSRNILLLETRIFDRSDRQFIYGFLCNHVTDSKPNLY